MKSKILITIFIFISVCISSCSKEYNNKYVKDADGKIYQLEWRIGSLYFLHDIDVNQIDSVRLK